MRDDIAAKHADLVRQQEESQRAKDQTEHLARVKAMVNQDTELQKRKSTRFQ